MKLANYCTFNANNKIIFWVKIDYECGPRVIK